MKSRFDTWTRRITVLVVALVAAASIAAAVRTASWAPIAETAWLPAVLVSAYSRPARRCARRCGMTGFTE